MGYQTFFTSLRTGSKMDSSSSKSEPISEPVSELSRNESIRKTDEVKVDPGIDGVQGDPVTTIGEVQSPAVSHDLYWFFFSRKEPKNNCGYISDFTLIFFHMSVYTITIVA